MARDHRSGVWGGAALAPPAPAPSSLNPRRPAPCAASSRMTHTRLALRSLHGLPYPRTTCARGPRRRPTGRSLAWDTYGAGWEYYMADRPYPMADGAVSIGLVVGLDYKNSWVELYYGLQARSASRTRHVHAHLGRATEPPAAPFYGMRVDRVHRSSSPAGLVNTRSSKGTHSAMRPKAAPLRPPSSPLKPRSTPPPATFENRASASTAPPPKPPLPIPSLQRLCLRQLRIHFGTRGRDHLPLPTPNANLWAVRKMRPGFATRLGLAGDESLDELARRPRYAPGGCVRADRVPHVRAATEHGPDELVVLTGTNHAAGEARWILKERRRMLGGVDAQETAPPRRSHVAVNVGTDAGLLQRAFPPCLYEYMADDGGRVVLGNAGAEAEAERWEGTKLVINFQVPTQYITWTVPEAGGGPSTHLPGVRLSKFVRRSNLHLQNSPQLQQKVKLFSQVNFAPIHFEKYGEIDLLPENMTQKD
ncbi:hypothetical protein DFH09DRAFT_1083296 [Mycena vulgaris]|nr:hypothetical protein DFH09DRAFT_1083296 [Mycena vulgaris]